VQDSGMRLFGQLFIIVNVIVFNILLLNLIIAILANTYNLFDLRSSGLFLSEILNKRDELLYDESYGAFLAAIPPINAIQFPMIPAAVLLRKGHPMLIMINDYIMKIQYCMFMLVFFAIFIVVSIVLIPVAWVMGCIDKSKHPSRDKMDNIVNLMFFIIGPVILFFDVIADLYYFWMNNFRQNLLQNIIAKEISNVTHKSLRELDYYSKFMI
jgi:hypothetical protein